MSAVIMTGSCPGREARAENPERKPGEKAGRESQKREQKEDKGGNSSGCQ
jgi:hypothetical protein